MAARHRVTVVCHGAYACLDAGSSTPVGGMEFRASHFARFLARRDDLDVSLASHLPAAPVDVEGLRLIPLVPGPAPRHRRVAQRVLDRRFPGIPRGAAWRALESLADGVEPPRWYGLDGWSTSTLCLFGVNGMNASLVRSAREHGVRTVLLVAWDKDLDRGFFDRPRDRTPFGDLHAHCAYLLRHVHDVVVQTDEQRALLASVAGREATVITNPLPVESTADDDGPRDTFLWVGRADTFQKRPEILLDVARRLPHLAFSMIVNRFDEDVYRRMASSLPPNVRIAERAAPAFMGPWYRRAIALLSTSASEGMPNAFLQAGSHGTPVVSLSVDPGKLLESSGGGTCAYDDRERFIASIDRHAREPAIARAAGLALRAWVAKHHDPSEKAAQLARVILQNAK
jgi:glycosyltransferase involved in cell wall biosynthesis